MAFQIPKKGNTGPELKDAEDKDLIYWLERKTSELGESRYQDRDRQWIAAATAELRGRGIEPSRGAPPPASAARQNGTGQGAQPTANGAANGAAIARAADQGQMVIGTFGDGTRASQALMEAASAYHLVTPASVVGRLPEGCEVVLSLVQVDPYGPEVYQITGDRSSPKDSDTVGIDRVALDRIAAAAGVSWVYSRRTDDGSHPHYCSWEAKARFRNFDMSHSDYPANVEIDTRESGDIRGAAAQEIRDKQSKKEDKGNAQLLELRKFLTRHAESKAKNRAIAARGLRRSYKRVDLKKPFAVAKLQLTGHSEDPEARRHFREMIGASFLASQNMMFAPAAPPPASHTVIALPQPEAVPMFAPRPPPPVGMSFDPGDREDFIDEQPGEPTPSPAVKPASQPGATPTGKPVNEDADPVDDLRT